MEIKADIVREICDLVAIPEYTTTSGSSIPRRFFSDLLDTFGIVDEGDSVTASKKMRISTGTPIMPVKTHHLAVAARLPLRV